MKEELSLSTDMVDPYIRNDWWRTVSSVIYMVSPASAEPKTRLAGYVKSHPMGDIVLGLTAFNSQYVDRNRAMIAQDCLDLYLVQLIIAGDYRADFNGTNTIVRPGDIFILDLTQPLSSFKEAGSRITVAVPRSELNRAINNRNLHGIVLRRESSITNLLANYIIGTHDISKSVKSDEIDTVQSSLINLISGAFNSADPASVNHNGLQLPLRQRVLDYIDRNIGSTFLSVDNITKTFYVSRSHLYRSFENDGGVMKLIQDKRLDLAYRMLTNEKINGRSIKEISNECGFSNVNVFIRLFKARFDCTPSDARNVDAPFRRESDVALTLHQHLERLTYKMKLNDQPQADKEVNLFESISKYHV